MSGTSQQASPDERAASLRLAMLTVVRRLTDIAADARVDALAAKADGDNARREYLMGEHRGLMEAAEALLAFDWTAAWREACTIGDVEDLDELRPRSLVRDEQGEYFEKLGSGWDCLSEDGTGGLLQPYAVRLPALLLWHPAWDAAAQKHSGGS